MPHTTDIALGPGLWLDEADLRDLDEQQLADFRASAVPAPGQVITAMQRLGDERRYDVPVTAVCPEYTSDDLRDRVTSGEGSVAELAQATVAAVD